MYERVKNLCNENEITITALCLEITGSSGNLTTWKKNNFKADSIAKICIKFGVSADYLLFGKTQNLDKQLNSDEQTLLDDYKKLDLRGKSEVIHVLYKELERINQYGDTERIREITDNYQ